MAFIISNQDMLKKFVEKYNDTSRCLIVICATKEAQNLLSTALLSITHNELIKNTEFTLPSKTTIHNAYVKKVFTRRFLLSVYSDTLFDELWNNPKQLGLFKSGVLTKILEFRFITKNLIGILKNCFIEFVKNPDLSQVNGVALSEIIMYLEESEKKSTDEIETGFYYDPILEQWRKPYESKRCCVKYVIKDGLFSKICNLNDQIDYTDSEELDDITYTTDLNSKSEAIFDQIKKKFNIERVKVE